MIPKENVRYAILRKKTGEGVYLWPRSSFRQAWVVVSRFLVPPKFDNLLEYRDLMLHFSPHKYYRRQLNAKEKNPG